MESKRSKSRKVVQHGNKAIVFPIYNWRRSSDTLKCFYCSSWRWWSRYWQRGLKGFWPVIFLPQTILSRLVQQTISETEIFGRIPELMKKSSKAVVMVMLMMMWQQFIDDLGASASQRSNLWLGVRRPILTVALRNSIVNNAQLSITVKHVKAAHSW